MSYILRGVLSEGDVIPFRRKGEGGDYKNLPKEILILAKECYKKAKEQEYEEYHTNPEYRNHVDNELGQIAREIENLGFKIGENETTKDIIIRNPGGRQFVLPADDAERSIGWARINTTLREDDNNMNSNDNESDPEVTIPGVGRIALSRLKRKAEFEAKDLAKQIASGKYRNAAYNIEQLSRTIKALAGAAQPKADVDEAAAGGGIMFPVKSLDGVEKAFADKNSPAATNWANSKQRKEKKIDPWKLAKQKKPSLDEIWDKITTVIGNMFPDGDPVDFLYPWLEQNGLDYTDLARACRKNGYKDLEDYWKDLEQSTGVHSGMYGEQIDEDPDYPAVSNQPGGWRQAKLRPAGQLSEGDGTSDAVYDAIRNRITTKHLDVVSKYGPAKVMAAIEDVSDYLDDLEEIGSSDVSIWTSQVIEGLEKGYYDHLDEGNSFNAATTYRPKQAGTFAEDITGHGSGQSYRKFKPKKAGTFKKKTESAILKGIQNESRKNAGR